MTRGDMAAPCSFPTNMMRPVPQVLASRRFGFCAGMALSLRWPAFHGRGAILVVESHNKVPFTTSLLSSRMESLVIKADRNSKGKYSNLVHILHINRHKMPLRPANTIPSTQIHVWWAMTVVIQQGGVF